MSIAVTAAPFALQPDRGRTALSIQPGLTVAEIVKLALPDLPEAVCGRVRVTLLNRQGMTVLDASLWWRVRPRDGVQIVITITAGKDGLRTLLQILVVVAATAISGFLATGPLAGLFGLSTATLKGALTFGLTALGGLLINALLPVPDAEKAEKSPFAISGWKNAYTPDAPMPIPFGKHRYAPPFAASSYIEVVGDVIYTRASFIWGLGPLLIEDIKLGDTPIDKFDEVEIETRQGLPGDPPLTLTKSQVLEETIGADLERPLPRGDDGEIIAGPAEAKPVSRFTAGDASGCCLIFAFPAGLFWTDDKGRRKPNNVSIQVRYRLEGVGSWTLQKVLKFRATKTVGFFRAYRFNFPTRGRYEVECDNLTAEWDDPANVSKCTWQVLQTLRPEYPFNFSKPIAVTAVRIKATAQLNGTLDTLNGVVTRIAPDWDEEEEEWVAQPTQSPASASLFALRGPGLYRPVPDEEIDFPAFQDWHEFCALKGLRYNRIHDFESKFGETLAAIGAAGRAVVRHNGRKWTVVIDRPREAPVDLVNPRNSSQFKWHASYFTPPHALRVPFLDETNNFQQAERIVRWPGYEGPIDVTEELKLPGKTHPDEIYREAMRRMFEIQHRAVGYTAVQQGAARTATTGDLVMASRDVLKRAVAAARVKAVRGNLVEVDDLFVMQEGENYAIRFLVFDDEDTVGHHVVRTIATDAVAGGARAVRVTGTGDLPPPGAIVHFGPAAQDSLPLILVDIERGKNNSSVLSMLPAAEIIDELTDALVIPAWNGRVGAEIDGDLVAPEPPRVISVTSGEVAGEPSDGITILLAPGAGTAIVATFEVYHRLDGDIAWLGPVSCDASEANVTLEAYLRGDVVQFYAVAVGIDGDESDPTATITTTVGADEPAIPEALPDGAVTIAGRLGHAELVVVTGADANTTQLQFYRNAGGPLDRAVDAIGAAIGATPLSTISKIDGDATRANLLSNSEFDTGAAWTFGVGWAHATDRATHTPGSAGDLSQAITIAAGGVARIAVEIAGRTAGTLTPKLVGGAGVVGSAVSADGLHLTRLTAVTGTATLAFEADSAFDGSIVAAVFYVESAASVPQGQQRYFVEPLNEDDVPGPVTGPITITII